MDVDKTLKDLKALYKHTSGGRWLTAVEYNHAVDKAISIVKENANADKPSASTSLPRGQRFSPSYGHQKTEYLWTSHT